MSPVNLEQVALPHARIQEFSSGGFQVRLTKKALTTFFFFFLFFLSILRKSNGQFQRNLSVFKVPEGVQNFPGGSNFSHVGSNCLFPIETHITCDPPDPLSPPPLDPHLRLQILLWVISDGHCGTRIKIY